MSHCATSSSIVRARDCTICVARIIYVRKIVISFSFVFECVICLVFIKNSLFLSLKMSRFIKENEISGIIFEDIPRYTFIFHIFLINMR